MSAPGSSPPRSSASCGWPGSWWAELPFISPRWGSWAHGRATSGGSTPGLPYNGPTNGSRLTVGSARAAVELIRGLYNLRAHQRGCVLTIGAFDGIHVGHQEMIRVLKDCARRHGLPAALMSFEPTPREFFARVAGKGPPPARLTRFREKFEALERFGVDRFVCLRFDERVRCLGREQFVG